MKGLLKKIVATALAFTLLGTGMTISKNSPKSDNTIISAHAAAYCPNHNGTYTRIEKVSYYQVPWNWMEILFWKKYRVTYCSVCGRVLNREYIGDCYPWE